MNNSKNLFALVFMVSVFLSLCTTCPFVENCLSPQSRFQAKLFREDLIRETVEAKYIYSSKDIDNLVEELMEQIDAIAQRNNLNNFLFENSTNRYNFEFGVFYLYENQHQHVLNKKTGVVYSRLLVEPGGIVLELWEPNKDDWPDIFTKNGWMNYANRPWTGKVPKKYEGVNSEYGKGITQMFERFNRISSGIKVLYTLGSGKNNEYGRLIKVFLPMPPFAMAEDVGTPYLLTSA